MNPYYDLGAGLRFRQQAKQLMHAYEKEQERHQAEADAAARKAEKWKRLAG